MLSLMQSRNAECLGFTKANCLKINPFLVSELAGDLVEKIYFSSDSDKVSHLHQLQVVRFRVFKGGVLFLFIDSLDVSCVYSYLGTSFPAFFQV